ncbi:KAP family P-loop NTPase fold protein [Methanosarcina mazei]|nr:P-loop NTPase fold protein [Methanosarcina mazei]
MFNSDRPIKHLSEDELNRQNFAMSIGEAILKSQTKDSLVIGLLGKWGSGKTSLVNMIVEHIVNISTSFEFEEQPIVIYFNPWNFSGQNQLISQFFNKLSSTLERPDYSKDLKKAGHLLKTISKIAKPFTFVPTLSAAASACSEVANSVAEATESAGELYENDLDGIKKDISDILENQNMKMVIVIDDIDRLNNMEIRQIFQLVKTLADFPNSIYLLTFDKKVVTDALKKEQQGHEEEYLEKIVQVPLDIPLISKIEVEILLEGRLKKLIEDIPENKFDRVYWGNIYQSGFKYFFENIRDVTRYINVLNFNYELVKDEVNLVDLIAISAVQVFIPEVYQKIRDNKEIFTLTSTKKGMVNLEEYQQVCNDIINSVNEKNQKFLHNYLKILFPGISTIYENVSYDRSFERSWRINRNICSEDVFDVYFKFSLPNGEISQREIESIIEYSNDTKKIFNKLLELIEYGKILSFLDRFPDHANMIKKENIGSIVSCILDVGDLFPDDESVFYGTPMKTHLLTNSLIKRCSTQDERFTILKDSIQDSTLSLYTLVWEVDFQDELHGKYHYEKESEQNLTVKQDLIVSSVQLDKLERLVCDKIKDWAEKGNLESHKKIVPILQIWKQWGADKTEIDSVINEIIKHDSYLINFIFNCVSPRHSWSVNDYVPKTTWDISFEAIEEFIDLSLVESRLKEMNTLDKLKNVTDKEEIAIKRFLDNVDQYKLQPKSYKVQKVNLIKSQ